MSIISVGDDCDISEDSFVLFALPDTIFDTRYNVVKKILTHCALLLPLCHGQASDGAAVLQGGEKVLPLTSEVMCQEHFLCTACHIHSTFVSKMLESKFLY